MKMMKSMIALFACVALFSTGAFAQKNYFKDAERAFDSREFHSAIELYKSAYSKEKNKERKAQILFKTGECYRLINDTKNAENYYSKAIKAKYAEPIAVLYLADAKKANQKYDEAITEYNNYKAAVPSDPRGENGAKSCEMAQKWKDTPTRYKVENVSMLNTKQSDYAPGYADKKYKTLYFVSGRETATGGKTDDGLGQVYNDLFEAKLDKNGKWSTPVPVVAPISTSDHEGPMVMNPKRTVMFFTRCIDKKGKVENCQLYSANKKGNAWDEAILLPFCDAKYNFGHPTISADEQVLIFASDMAGSMAKANDTILSKDLWMVSYDKKKKEWGAPVNLGPEINTPGDEMFPFIHEDGTLYFSSNGHLGMGGLDLFKANKIAENKWGKVENLKSPMNSPADDFGIIFESKAERGYFSSNREGSKGSDDIWSFMLPPCNYALDGVIVNSKDKSPIEGITVKLTGSDGTTSETKTDKAGYYKFAENGTSRFINNNTSYVITTMVPNDLKTASAPLGFLNTSDKGKITTVGETECNKVFKKDFVFDPIMREVRFPDVLYDLAKWDLRPESKDSLNFLYQTLIDNPTFVIELSAHTDSRGSDAANQKLSENRAKSCVEYLISKGIPAARMKPVGYGEKRLLVTDAQIAKMKTKEEKEAGHQKNRRTVFSVLSKDYVDPNAPKEAPKQEAPKKTETEDEE